MESIPLFLCPECGKEKPRSGFHKGRSPGGRYYKCKACCSTGTTTFVDLGGTRIHTWVAVRYIPEQKRWLVRCDCGNERLITNANWRRSQKANYYTCDVCNKPRQYNQLPYGEASFNALYNNYRHHAVQRGYAFELTKTQFREHTQSPCAYCGRPPSQVSKTGSGTPYTFTGIDRIDSGIGYIEGNCAPCCKWCNLSKLDMNLGDWLEHVKRIYEHMNLGEVR